MLTPPPLKQKKQKKNKKKTKVLPRVVIRIPVLWLFNFPGAWKINVNGLWTWNHILTIVDKVKTEKKKKKSTTEG